MTCTFVDDNKKDCQLGGYKLNSEAGAILDELLNNKNSACKKYLPAEKMKFQKSIRKTILQNNLGVLEKEKSKITGDYEEYKKSRPIVGDMTDNMKRIQMNIMQYTAD